MLVPDPGAISLVMWQYHPELLGGAVPRYTSYPTAAQFNENVGEAAVTKRLAAIGPEEALSLYVHIPYCHEICWYCGCNTGAANKSSRLTAYLEALEHEIALVAARLHGRGKVRHIAFGGGSPNAIPLVDFLRLVQHLTLCFRVEAADISIELDPRNLDHDWMRAMRAIGVKRVNLGVQTFAPEIQRNIGRVQPYELIADCVAGLRDAGVSEIGFDLLYGLPAQTVDDLAATLDRTIELRPARIALFGYAHMPRLLPRQRRIDASRLPAMDMRFAMASLGYERLTQAGYQPIGFDHFALPDDSMAAAARAGTLRRNFQGFTDDQAQVLIGLGASAISMFPDLIVQNEKNAGRYRMMLSADRLPVARGLERDAEDMRRAAIIEDILCRGDADMRGVHPSDIITRFEEMGLARRENGRVILSHQAIPYARSVAAAFDAYLQPAETRFSNAV